MGKQNRQCLIEVEGDKLSLSHFHSTEKYHNLQRILIVLGEELIAQMQMEIRNLLMKTNFFLGFDFFRSMKVLIQLLLHILQSKIQIKY